MCKPIIKTISCLVSNLSSPDCFLESFNDSNLFKDRIILRPRRLIVLYCKMLSSLQQHFCFHAYFCTFYSNLNSQRFRLIDQ